MSLEIHPEHSPLLTDEAKHERAYMRRVIGGILAGCFVVAFVFWAKDAKSQDIPVHVFEDEAVKLQLFASPCEDETAKHVAANSPLKDLPLQKALSNWVVNTPMGAFRVDFAGCWTAFNFQGKDGYAVAFEDKEVRFFPAEGFKKTKRQIGI